MLRAWRKPISNIPIKNTRILIGMQILALSIFLTLPNFRIVTPDFNYFTVNATRLSIIKYTKALFLMRCSTGYGAAKYCQKAPVASRGRRKKCTEATCCKETAMSYSALSSCTLCLEFPFSEIVYHIFISQGIAFVYRKNLHATSPYPTQFPAPGPWNYG